MQYQTPQHEISKCPIPFQNFRLAKLLPSHHHPAPSAIDTETGEGLKKYRGHEKYNIPLMTHTRKLPLIRRIRLHPQTRREHELPHRSAKAGQECVEWLSSHHKNPLANMPNELDQPFSSLSPLPTTSSLFFSIFPSLSHRPRKRKGRERLT